jgi:ubiquinone/menaquinone biosynthesis C-methylase UbiE
MDHAELVKAEFTRQAERFANAAAVNDAALTQRFVAAVGPEPRIVLDVACGPGILTAALAPHAREVVAFDITPEMLNRARQRCAAAGLANVSFREGSAADLPFADASFDTVVTRLSLHHFPQPGRAIAEMARVLRPGGLLVVADVVSSEDAEQSALHNALEVLRDPSHVRMLPGSEFEALIARAGLTIAATSEWDQPRAFEDWAAIVNDPARTGPLHLVMRALAAAGQRAGIGLSLADGVLRFVHHWLMIAARK